MYHSTRPLKGGIKDRYSSLYIQGEERARLDRIEIFKKMTKLVEAAAAKRIASIASA